MIMLSIVYTKHHYAEGPNEAIIEECWAHRLAYYISNPLYLFGAMTLSIMTYDTMTLIIKESFATFSINTLSISTLCHYAECRYAECPILFIVMSASLC
jgi:hypothetical protein